MKNGDKDKNNKRGEYMFCVFCGKKIDDDAAFCTNCGKNLSEKRVRFDIEFCTNCGSKIDREAAFCTSCGSKVLKEETKTEDVKTATSIQTELKMDVSSEKKESEKIISDNPDTIINDNRKSVEENISSIPNKQQTENIKNKQKKIGKNKTYGKILGIVACIAFILLIAFIAAKPTIGEHFRDAALDCIVTDYNGNTEVDYDNYYKYGKLAALFGDEYGYLILGDCYKNGMGIEKNIEKAIKYYNKAISKGNEKAKQRLESLTVSETANISNKTPWVSNDTFNIDNINGEDITVIYGIEHCLHISEEEINKLWNMTSINFIFQGKNYHTDLYDTFLLEKPNPSQKDFFTVGNQYEFTCNLQNGTLCVNIINTERKVKRYMNWK